MLFRVFNVLAHITWSCQGRTKVRLLGKFLKFIFLYFMFSLLRTYFVLSLLGNWTDLLSYPGGHLKSMFVVDGGVGP